MCIGGPSTPISGIQDDLRPYQREKSSSEHPNMRIFSRATVHTFSHILSSRSDMRHIHARRRTCPLQAPYIGLESAKHHANPCRHAHMRPITLSCTQTMRHDQLGCNARAAHHLHQRRQCCQGMRVDQVSSGAHDKGHAGGCLVSRVEWGSPGHVDAHRAPSR